MACHREFQTAGKTPGLQVWRVENMDLKPVPRQLYGNFFIGDAYIVLYTTSAPSYNIHTWMGDDASQDEKGAAAIYMTQLDDFMHGAPRQFTEFQNEESVTFMGYFKSGIKYQKGGVASGFQHVVTNAEDVKRLLHVKGRRAIKATEVDLSWDSFNKGDCFIIDLGKNIYHWSGSESNRFERIKTTEVAIDIRDNERKGRAEIHMTEEGSEPEEVLKVLGPMPTLTPASNDDEAADVKNKSHASLYLITDASGSMKTSLVADKPPFKQSLLSKDECYILDNGADKKIFVWKGSEASTAERKAALCAAKQYIEEKKYHRNTQIQVMPAGGETSLFKQFFFNWLDKAETTKLGVSCTPGRIAKVQPIPFDASTLHSSTIMAAHHAVVDDGSGKVQIWRVEHGDKAPVDPSTYGQFYGGDCYLVLYTYKAGGKENHIIYIWQGRKCSKDELGASAILAVALDDSMGGVATQVRVTQGQEPPHLVSMFKGKPLVVHLGGTSRGGGETTPGSTRLFHIRMSSNKALRAVEVEPVASSLNTNDVFVLKSHDSVTIWKGKGSSAEELAAGKYVAGLLGGTAAEVEETKETDCFWKALGGKKPYQTSPALQKVVKPPQLYGCSNKTGRLIAEPVPGEFTQMDLATDDVMILDARDQLYIWIGNEANETEKTGAPKIAQDYLKSDPSGRSDIPIYIFKQGEEPACFRGWFQAWDSTLWDKDPMQLIQQRIKKH